MSQTHTHTQTQIKCSKYENIDFRCIYRKTSISWTNGGEGWSVNAKCPDFPAYIPGGI